MVVRECHMLWFSCWLATYHCLICGPLTIIFKTPANEVCNFSSVKKHRPLLTGKLKLQADINV